MLMLVAALVLCGLIAAVKLPQSRLPAIEVPKVVVDAALSGMPAAEVRSLLTQPLEDALSSAKGMTGLRSVSGEGRVLIIVDFSWGEKSSRAAGRIREIVDASYPALPEGASKPLVLPYDPDAEAVFVLALRSLSGDLSQARRIAEYDVKARLRKIDGTGAVLVSGGREKEIAVFVDMSKAGARGLAISDVVRALSQENADSPAGSVMEGNFELVALSKGRVRTVSELRQILATGPGGPFALGDIARVAERDKKPLSVFARDGEEQVCVEVFLRPGSDPVAVSKALRAEVASMNGDFGKDVELRLVRDESTGIAEGIRNLSLSALGGALVAIVVLFALLRDLRAGMLVSMTIPVSVAAGLSVLALLGKSINGMSLGGMALAIGMISDNAVVVLDSISSRIRGERFKPSDIIITSAVMDTVSSSLGSTLTSTVVFLPVMFLPGAIGALFSDLAISLVSANVAGWLLSVFAVPALYLYFWKPSDHSQGKLLETRYRFLLRKVLRKPVPVYMFAVLLAVGGTALVASRPASFMPVDAAREYTVHAGFPPGTSLEALTSQSLEFLAALRKNKGIKEVYARAGSELEDVQRRADSSYSNERLVVSCLLAPKSSPVAMKAFIETTAASLLGRDVSVSVDTPTDPAARILGMSGDANLAVFAPDPLSAKTKTLAFQESLQELAGDSLASLAIYPNATKSRVLVLPDRERLASLGLSLSDIASAIGHAGEGVILGQMENEGRSRDIRVLADFRGSAMSPSDLPGIPVKAGESTVNAGSLVTFSMQTAPSSMARRERQDVLYLSPKASPGSEKKLAKALAEALALNPAVRNVDESALRRYGTTLMGSVALVIILLYLVLGAQFESFSLPLILLTTIPLALAGAGPALFLAGAGLDSGSVLGLVVLFGVAVNNAIVLYETSSARARAGSPTVLAAYAGASDRVRPVLATSLTTLVSLVPIAFSPTGAAQKSMALAMLGGLFASGGLTLFISPLIFVKYLSKKRGIVVPPPVVVPEEEASA